MSFDLIFNNNNNSDSQFKKCWLAATNPKLFLSLNKSNAINEIDVPYLCEEIIKWLNKMNGDFKLRLVSQLAFGTVFIHQKQVQNVYESVVTLMRVNTALLENIFNNKRQRISSEKSRKKLKQCDAISLLTETEQNLTSNTFENELFTEVSTNTTNLKKTQINEVLHDRQCIPEDDEGLGEMTTQERNSFVELIKNTKSNKNSYGRNFNAATSSYQVPTLKNIAKAVLKKKLNKMGFKRKARLVFKSRNKTTNLNLSLPDVIRYNKSNMEDLTPVSMQGTFDSIGTNDLLENVQEMSTGNIQNFRSENLVSSTPIVKNATSRNYQNDDDIILEVERLVPELSHDLAIEAISHDDEVAQIAKDLCVDSNQNCLLKRRSPEMLANKGKVLKVDKTTKIKINTIIKQCMPQFQLRCTEPRMDAVLSYHIKYVAANKLLEEPGRSLPIPLIPLFKRNLNTRLIDVDCDMMPSENSLVNQNTNTANSSDQNLPNFPLEAEYFASQDIEAPAIVSSENETKLSEPPMIKYANEKFWEKEIILEILNNLWKRGVKSINMKTLCHNDMKKNQAARIFYTIIELNAKQYLHLEKDPDRNEIIHIKPGNIL